MKVTVKQPIQSHCEATHPVWGSEGGAGGYQDHCYLDWAQGGSGVGGWEDEFLAERTACDYPDNEISNEVKSPTHRKNLPKQ